MRLYELADQYIELQDQYNSVETDEELEQVLQKLLAVDEQLDSKLASCWRILKNMDADAKAIKAEEDELRKRRQAIENRVTRLKDYTKSNMEAAGITKFDNGVEKLRIQVNGGNPATDIQVKPEDLPDQFRILVPAHYEADLASIIDAWKKEEPLPDGVSCHRGTHLRIG
jgi:hypothetical protein